MYYQSRYHLTNGRISLALDSLSGELLELNDEQTGENLIKNHSYALPQPFSILLGDGKTCLFPGNAEAIYAHPELRPEFTIENSGQAATVHYRALWDGRRVHRVAAEYTVELPEGTADSLWRLSIRNDAELQLKDVRFPCLNGIYLGKDWRTNELVYPYVAGVKIKDPVTAFATPNQRICWKWQDYKYVYGIGIPARQLQENLYGMEESYSGNLTMKWLDYYGEELGLYFACYDPEPRICSLRADTQGANDPGMNFSFRHPLGLGTGESWSSPETVAALHSGDWHEGAKRYRAFHRDISPEETACPNWFHKSAGLVAHYDFKYQNGGVVHRYADIGRLLDEAKEMGLNHLLLSGWHKDGFDHGFPEYTTDDDLGTQEELRQQIHKLKEDGGHVAFYINSRLCNTKYEHLRDFIGDNAVRLEDGSLLTEQYGAGGLRFAVQCIGSKGWRRKLEETVGYVTGDIGTDGMYLDQLVMGYPCLCKNPEHDHRYGDWNCWYQEVLKNVHREREEKGGETLCLMHEGVSDSYGPLVSGQLVSTFSYHHTGAFPELYRFTFPEQMLVDMLYPERNMAMRPVHVGQASRDIMDRAFRTGMYYWIYDLVDDNSFTRDPKQYAYLKEMIRLRKFWLERFGQGSFCDTEYILGYTEGVEAACYELDHARLVVCSNSSGDKGTLKLCLPENSGVSVFTADNLDGETTVITEGSVEIPAVPLSLLYIEY